MASRVALLALAAGTALALPFSNTTFTNFTKRQSCSNPLQRKAWHKLTDDEKKSYIDAELCLMSAPATGDLRGAETVFDELQSIHVYLAEVSHFVGAFLPFHRYHMWAHEYMLREVCGYEGAQPYWEESIDAGKFVDSVVFDPETGFGGDGSGRNQCITDGPFADYQNNLGPGYVINQHCIDRRINDIASLASRQSEVDKCMATSSFSQLWSCIENGPHGGGHGGTGGEMQNPISSPGDPLFYLHHTWLDKLWWDWQEADSERVFEISGNNKMAPPFAEGIFGGRPDDMEKPVVKGDPGDVTTLSHILEMKGVMPDLTIEDVMDTRGVLCFEYVDFRDDEE